MPAAIGYGEAASPGGLALGLGGRGGSPVGGRAEPKECQGDSRVRSPAGAHLAALAGRPCVSCGPWRGREAWVCLAWTGRPVRTLPESPGRLWVTAAGVRGQWPKWASTAPSAPFWPDENAHGAQLRVQAPGSESRSCHAGLLCFHQMSTVTKRAAAIVIFSF